MKSEFEVALLKLFRINDKSMTELTLNTPIRFDSLTLTELCILIEEHFDIPTEFAIAKKFKTVGDLNCYILEKTT